ncbi:hypothetical protein WR25_24240 [Diploscapter pachys]|uniref:Uncharacterized protein n=1 Tax=Diploscapter pachys TaxID=2018661 RepID=A0A2A2M4X4_9BILA|nr:hypothetical protein WR25_24240 [Diploscapter pachys]
MPEQRRTDRPREEGHGKAREAHHLPRRRTFPRKEQRRKHQRRGGGVNVEIVEFHRRTDQTRGQDPARRGWRDGGVRNFGGRELAHAALLTPK